MTEGEVAVLANPSAGRGRHAGLIPAVVARLGGAGRPVRMLDAGTAEEAAKACVAAVDGGASALVAVGGDGTAHLALQAVAGTGVPFGVVPAGTGNDFATAVGAPADALTAATALASALGDGRTTQVDLARLAGDGSRRWYGTVLAAGFDAIVNERANRMRWPRGPRRYDIAIMLELLALRPRSYRLVLDGVEHRADGILVAVGNTASYGGGMRICPAARPDDGLLQVVVVGPLGRAQFVRMKPKVYSGAHVDHPTVTVYRAARVELHADGITGYADGERAFALPVTVECVPGALTVLTS